MWRRHFVHARQFSNYRKRLVNISIFKDDYYCNRSTFWKKWCLFCYFLKRFFIRLKRITIKKILYPYKYFKTHVSYSLCEKNDNRGQSKRIEIYNSLKRFWKICMMLYIISLKHSLLLFVQNWHNTYVNQFEALFRDVAVEIKYHWNVITFEN